MSEICNSSTSKRRNMDFKWETLRHCRNAICFQSVTGIPHHLLRNEVCVLKMLQVNFAELRPVTLVREYGLAARKDGEQIYFGWFLSAP